jgi:transcriptional regulator with PAS, ATPase and Fis domain
MVDAAIGWCSQGLRCVDDAAHTSGSSGPAERLFIGQDPKILEVLELVEKVAATVAPVLITGESGTGKEMIAHEIHRRSDRYLDPWVTVNCGAIAETLGESELFGHTKGAFTGADRRKRGKFECADRGTLFLDEVGELTLSLQVKLLRVLQNGEFAPVGQAENEHCDVRVIAATNHDLGELLRVGKFRSDLYYRLSVIRIELPPLRERRADIPLLTQHFCNSFADDYGRPAPRVSDRCLDVLGRYSFPGNVRELSNMMHRAVILSDDVVSERALPNEIVQGRDGESKSVQPTFHELKQSVIEQFERAYIAEMIEANGGVICRAAEVAGLSERSFHEKLRKYGLHTHADQGNAEADFSDD